MDNFIFIVSIILGIGCIFMCITFGIHEIAEARYYKMQPKEDELQKLLNAVNDKIIDLENDHSGSEMLQVRKADFHYFKGMILSLQDKEKVDDK